jgi:hypothetical protein
MGPLNPVLFSALTSVFGRPPKITNQGQAFTYTVEERGGGVRVKAQGEQYCVCCPDCGDAKYRLYFNHRYGTTISDPRVRGPLIDLAYCQHEQKKKPKWYALLGRALSDPSVALLVQENSRCSPQQGSVFGAIPTMGETVSLRSLAPSHQAMTYLRGRGYDPLYLNDIYGACLIINHPDERVARMAVGRVAFPFHVNGEFKMWQARLTYDLPKGQKFPPKWYFPPGTIKVPWGYDVASAYPVAILAEGISSALNFGPAGIGLGGKTLTYATRKLIAQRWKSVVVALDPDAGINHKPDERDYQEQMIRELTEEGVSAVGVRWQAGDTRDPGDIGPVGCLNLLRNSAPWVVEDLPYFRGA